MDHSNMTTGDMSPDTLKAAIQRTVDEMKYWTLSKPERKRIDAQRHREGLPKYRNTVEPQHPSYIVSPDRYRDMESKGYIQDGKLTKEGEKYVNGMI